MSNDKYRGIIPAFYACYDDAGEISPARTRKLARLLTSKGVNGLYVCGSSGECIYLTTDERKRVLSAVMDEVGGETTVIAHVACNNTRESMELASHAQSLGVDAIAAIPPIYFHLREHAIAAYWNDISSAAPDTDFVIYNIPQLAGVSLTKGLLREMLKNPRVIGVKNSSAPTQDIQMFRAEGNGRLIVFNGPDEQLVSGLAIGALGGIGGTYAVMPEVYIKLYEHFIKGDTEGAMRLQYAANELIYAMCGLRGNLYAVMKELIKRRDGLDTGGVRKPLPPIEPSDAAGLDECARLLQRTVEDIR